MGDDYLFGRVNPPAVVGEAGVGADGSEDGAGGDFAGLRLFDDGLEGVAGEAGAFAEEVEGVRVAVDHGMVGDAVGEGELFGALPAEEILLDIVAAWMAANRALTGVAGNGIGRVE